MYVFLITASQVYMTLGEIATTNEELTSKITPNAYA